MRDSPWILWLFGEWIRATGFENEYGEQMIFVFDRDKGMGLLYVGDAGWETSYEVMDGIGPEIDQTTGGGAVVASLLGGSHSRYIGAFQLDEAWAQALVALVPQLTGVQALKQRLTAAQVFGKEGTPAKVLAALAPQLTGELLQQP